MGATSPANVPQPATLRHPLPCPPSIPLPAARPGIAPLSITRLDAHRCRRVGNEAHAGRHIVELDTDRDALRQPHSGEDRVDGCEPAPARGRVRYLDPPRDAVHVLLHFLGVADQADTDRGAVTGARQRRFFEVGVDSERIRVHDGQAALAHGRVVALLDQEGGDPPVHGGPDLGPLQVDVRLRQYGAGALHRGAGNVGVGDERLFLLDRGGQRGQDLAAGGLVALVHQVRLGLLQVRRARARRRGVIYGVDHHQHVALVDMLVVTDTDLDDVARELRCDCDHIDAHAPIPCQAAQAMRPTLPTR